MKTLSPPRFALFRGKTRIPLSPGSTPECKQRSFLGKEPVDVSTMQHSRKNEHIARAVKPNPIISDTHAVSVFFRVQSLDLPVFGQLLPAQHFLEHQHPNPRKLRSAPKLFQIFNERRFVETLHSRFKNSRATSRGIGTSFVTFRMARRSPESSNVWSKVR